MNSNPKTIVAATLLATSLLSTARIAHADWDEVQPNSYIQLCPEWIGGDREYNGHGPRVTTSIGLKRSGGQLILHNEMHQIETVADWSEARLYNDVVLAQRLDGKRYTQVWARNVSGTWAWASMPDGPFFDVYDDFYVDTNHSVRTINAPKFWLQSVATNGDTGGKDIGNCTSDDAYLTVRTNKLFVMYQ